MFQYQPSGKRLRMGMRISLLTVLLIGLVSIGLALDVQAQYQLRKPGGEAAQASITVTGPAAGVTWEKGKRCEVTWNSSGIRGSVKIDLVDPQGKATSLARQTLNNGKYSFTLMRNVADGDYKVRVSSTDGKTVGESAATVHVGKASGAVQKTAVAGAVQQPAGTDDAQQAEPTGVTQAAKPIFQPRGTGQVAGEQAGGFTPATGTVGTIGGTQTGTAATAGTAAQDPAQLHEDEEGGVSVSGTVTQLGNLTAIQVPESDLQRMEIQGMSGLEAGLAGAMTQEAQQHRPPDDPTISVTRPDADDLWVAGASQPIRWNSDNLDGPVKIDMVHAVSAQQYDFYPVAANTENDGAANYTVPANLGTGPHNFYLQVATLDDQLKAFSPPIDVYHEPVDMDCKVMGLVRKSDVDNYVVYAEKDEWIQFDVWVRNNGTLPVVTVQRIKVLLVKEPEELVVADDEFGYGNMAPRLWYKSSDPLKYNIRHVAAYQGETVNLQAGAYRVEVFVDPLNQLGEDPPMRIDNHFVRRFDIR